MKKIKIIFCLLFIFCLILSSSIYATEDGTLSIETNEEIEGVLKENLTSSSGLVFDQSKESNINMNEIEDIDQTLEAEFTGVDEISGMDVTDNSIFDFDSYYRNYDADKGKSEAVDNDIFAVGILDDLKVSDYQSEDNTIKIEKEVNGNVYLVANHIEVNEKIEGNFFAVGDDVKINASIGGSVYIVATTVTLTEETDIYGSAHIVTQNFMMLSGDEYDSVIDNDLYLVSESANIDGSIQRNMNVAVKNITFDNSFYLGNLDNSHIFYGDSFTNNSSVESLESVAKKQELPTKAPLGVKYYVGKYVLSFFAGLVVVLAIVFFEKRTNFKLSENTSIKITRTNNFVSGLVFLVISILIAILLCISRVGILLGIIILLLYLLVLCLAIPVFSVVVSKKIIKEYNSLYIVLLASAICLVIDLLQLVPVLGITIHCIACVFGVGTIINSFKGEKLSDKETEKVNYEVDKTIDETTEEEKKEDVNEENKE